MGSLWRSPVYLNLSRWIWKILHTLVKRQLKDKGVNFLYEMHRKDQRNSYNTVRMTNLKGYWPAFLKVSKNQCEHSWAGAVVDRRRPTFDAEFFEELEAILLQADVGIKTTTAAFGLSESERQWARKGCKRG